MGKATDQARDVLSKISVLLDDCYSCCGDGKIDGKTCPRCKGSGREPG